MGDSRGTDPIEDEEELDGEGGSKVSVEGDGRDESRDAGVGYSDAERA